MKIAQLLNRDRLLESTIPSFDCATDYKDLTEPVNITRDVMLRNDHICKIPIKFGTVFGHFDVHMNNLTSLEGCPTRVEGECFVSRNNISSLVGSPEHVGEDFYCSHNFITSLEGAPAYIGGAFTCRNNHIASLVGIHKIIKRCTSISINNNPINEGGLGVLLIKDIQFISSDLDALQIINKYCGQGKRGMIDCQTELIKKGYKEFAKL